MNYSFVIGVDDSIYDLTGKGFAIEKDGDNFAVCFSEGVASIWEEFIAKRLEVGYWNEYIAGDRVIFLFRLQEGIKRYEVFNFQNGEVLSLCEIMCGRKFKSLKKMLLGNRFYAKIIKNRKK